MEYKNLSELRKAMDNGDIKEENVQIVLDNDTVNFYLCNCQNDEDGEGSTEIIVHSASGYYDIEELYKMVFTRANVDWC